MAIPSWLYSSYYCCRSWAEGHSGAGRDRLAWAEQVAEEAQDWSDPVSASARPLLRSLSNILQAQTRWDAAVTNTALATAFPPRYCWSFINRQSSACSVWVCDECRYRKDARMAMARDPTRCNVSSRDKKMLAEGVFEIRSGRWNGYQAMEYKGEQ